MKRVVIVGGGISGLATAHRLSELRRESKVSFEITLVEAKERLGGVIETEARGGFLLEGGPDAFISEKPWAIDLCRRLGLEEELLETSKVFRRSFIFSRGKLHPVPSGFYLMAPTRFRALLGTPLLSVGGKLRAACERWIPARRAEGDESVASFVRRRLGRELLERIGQPMIGGIYTADVETLSLEATFPRFLEMERRYGSVLRGLQKTGDGSPPRTSENRPPLASGPRYSLFVTLRGGMETLVKALKERLKEIDLRLGTAVRRIERHGNWKIHLASGEVLEAEALCLSLPAPEAARLLTPVAEDISEALREIPYESVVTVNAAFRRVDVPRALDGFGFVVPASERRNLIGGTFTSTKFPGRAPKESVLVRLFLGGALQRETMEWDDSEIEKTVLQELREILGVTQPPEFLRIHRSPQSMPQYLVGHASLVQAIEEKANHYPGLFLTGNAYHGIGIPDCIHHGEKTAERVESFLK